MKKMISFLKSFYLVIIGFVVGVMVWYTYGLSIPTNIDNSVQVIKKILISSDGVSVTGTNVLATFDANSTGAVLQVVGNIQFGSSGNMSSQANGKWASVLGGYGNKISSGMSASIAGGTSNILTGDNSTIIGGQTNKINGLNSTIDGGRLNDLIGSESSIVGGYDNNINGNQSTIIGGYQNTVNGNYSFAGGYKASVTHTGVFMWSDSLVRLAPNDFFRSVADNTFLIRAANGVLIGTGAPAANPVDLRVAGGSNGGKVGAVMYCDENGDNCVDGSNIGGGGDSYWTGNGADIWNTNRDKVGIGTGSPSQKLDVNGNININDSLFIRGKQMFLFPTWTNGQLRFNYEGTAYSGTMFMGDVIVSDWNPAVNGGNKGNFYVVGNGKVGIGTDTPSEKLEVVGTIKGSKLEIGAGASAVGSDSAAIGYNATASGSNSIAMGYSSTVNGNYSAIGGGRENMIVDNSIYSTVGGGYSNLVGGESGNPANFSIIGGGRDNAVSADHSTIGGGIYNMIHSNSDSSFIGGGGENVIFYGRLSVIGGGLKNHIYGSASVIGGGEGNNIYGRNSVIGGGEGNKIHNDVFNSTIGGGSGNMIGTGASYSTIPGGVSNSIGIDAYYAFAAGRRAKANHSGTFVWADSTNTDFVSQKTNSFIVRANGGVGIGTNNPTEDVQVGNYAWIGKDTATISSTTGGSFVRLNGADPFGEYPSPKYTPNMQLNYTSFSVTYNWMVDGGSSLDFKFAGGDYDYDTLMTIRSNGRVGIGVYSPSQTLELSGNVRLTNSGYIQAGTNVNQLYLGKNGNVGIGTASPIQKLDVNGRINVTNGVIQRGGAAIITTSDLGLYSTVSNDRMRFVTNAGNIVFYSDYTTNPIGSTPNLTIATNGNLTIRNDAYAHAYYYSSDKKLKGNLELIQDPLQKLIQLNGYNFTWKSNGEKSIGVIAQEVEKVFPELVGTDKEGIKSVQYGNLVAPIIEAIKELAVKVEGLFDKYMDQEQQIEELKARLQKIEVRLQKIENKIAEDK